MNAKTEIIGFPAYKQGDAMRVTGWTEEAEAEMGRDDDSVYYLLGGNIYRNQDSGTRWFCTKEAWEGCKKAYHIQDSEKKGKVTP